MKPVLVQTLGRTGSTLLMNLLKHIDGLYVAGEYPFEERIITYLYRLGNLPFIRSNSISSNLWNHESTLGPCPLMGPYLGRFDYFNKNENLDSLFKSIWEGFCQSKEFSGFKYYAEKNPSSTSPEISRILDAKNIFLIRDPKDQILSIRNFDKKRGYLGFGKGSEATLDGIQSICNSWKYLFSIYEKMNKESIVIKYEDLILNRELELEKIGQYLGGKINIDNFLKENQGYVEKHSTSKSDKDSIGQWKTGLTEAEIEHINKELKAFNSYFDYQ